MAKDNKLSITPKINKTALAKRDMNFFSIYSSSSGQVRSYSTMFLLFLLGFIIIGVGLYALFFLQSQKIRSNIENLNTEMKTEVYQKSLSDYSSIGGTLDTMNQEYYDITTLFYRVSDMSKVESKNMDIIQTNLPADITLTDFSYTKGNILLTGLANSYYSPLDLIANLSAPNLFTFVDIANITQQDLTALILTDAEKADIKPYTFTIKGSLENTYSVKVSKMFDGALPAPLTAVESKTYAVGDRYKIEGINTFTSTNKTYILSKIMINDVVVADQNVFTSIKLADSINGTVTSMVNIVLYYTLSSSNGGEQ